MAASGSCVGSGSGGLERQQTLHLRKVFLKWAQPQPKPHNVISENGTSGCVRDHGERSAPGSSVAAFAGAREVGVFRGRRR